MITIIRYELSQAGAVELGIFNIAGQRVKTLIDKQQVAGQYQVSWNGTDNTGRLVGSGVYFYRLSAGGHMQTKRLVLLK